ncbi:YidB family protein [Streptomyces sp. CWNU-1]|uniref:YidB family protein n=2 Tax=Streptomyces albipurpureus TaxID=2897419 RepID=A0ABT0UXJ6_9ACTN|nr:YidB family protein [Streptomyces sp. CWNU-1]MCM2393179.1 YidB family protein [Streptomyces sp. CWNU-1]
MAGNDLGSLLGSLLGGGGGAKSGGGAANILGSLLSTLGNKSTSASGGGNALSGLIDILAKSGITDQAKSWVGTGENKPVSGAQIAQAIPDDTLQKVAKESGVTPQQAADEIAQSLPQAVDRLTPAGQLPQSGTSLEDLIKEQRL